MNLKKYKKGLQKKLYFSNLKALDISIKNVIELMPKSKLSANSNDINGTFKFYRSGNITSLSNVCMYDGIYIIANDGGEANFKLTNGPFSYSDHCICFKCFEDYITINLFNYLECNKGKITYAWFTGSGLKNIDRNFFRQYKLPQTIYEESYAKIFGFVDNLIINYEDKLSKIILTKKFLLSHLFI